MESENNTTFRDVLFIMMMPPFIILTLCTIGMVCSLGLVLYQTIYGPHLNDYKHLGYIEFNKAKILLKNDGPKQIYMFKVTPLDGSEPYIGSCDVRWHDRTKPCIIKTKVTTINNNKSYEINQIEQLDETIDVNSLNLPHVPIKITK